jgi:hypothetical protein
MQTEPTEELLKKLHYVTFNPAPNAIGERAASCVSFLFQIERQCQREATARHMKIVLAAGPLTTHPATIVTVAAIFFVAVK